MLIPGKMNMKCMWCFMHCCSSDCLRYKTLSILNAKDKHTSAVFHNEQDRSEMAGSNDFTDQISLRYQLTVSFSFAHFFQKKITF